MEKLKKKAQEKYSTQKSYDYAYERAKNQSNRNDEIDILNYMIWMNLYDTPVSESPSNPVKVEQPERSSYGSYSGGSKSYDDDYETKTSSVSNSSYDYSPSYSSDSSYSSSSDSSSSGGCD